MRTALSASRTNRRKRHPLAAERPDREQLHDSAAAIDHQVLRHLDSYLLQLESMVRAAGGVVHRASDAAAANRIVLDLVRGAGASEIIRADSALTTEIGLGDTLAAAGITTCGIDLAAHDVTDPVLRERFLRAEVAVTGANFVVSESGTVIIVESESAGRMCLTLPRTLISVIGIDRIVPTWRDLEVVLALPGGGGERMPRCISTWTGITDGDGPREFHLVLVDNVRTRALADELVRAAVLTDRHAAVVPREYLRHAPGIEPHDRAAVLSLFLERSKHHGAEIHRVTAAELPETVAGALNRHGAHSVVAPLGVPASWLAEWAAAPGNRLVSDEPELSALELDRIDAVVTSCAAAVADSATVVLDGGSGQGRRAPTLLPDCHICVVRAEQVASAIPEVIAVLDPDRPLTWFSGLRHLVLILVEPE
ncbi:LUD domain-containing protein [Nocardia sp. NBC_01327]|uniref:LUD domain-containing protein n=1 Tax=Nocardia sp. NBC_01327 TaxID=2903593 RepID=UPI002E12DB43|nr:LUD domain-containing protein [Nocardia sp. NBC_01327]